MSELKARYPDMSWDQQQDMAEDRVYWRSRYDNAIADFDYLAALYRELSNLRPKDDFTFSKRQIQREILDLRRDKQEFEAEWADMEVIDRRHFPDEAEKLIRRHHQARVFYARKFAWVCEAYQQTPNVSQIFNSLQNGRAIRYDRYESNRVEEIEENFADVMEIGDEAAVLATSSGMAAYNIIDTYLRAHVLEANDKVLVAHDLYSEVREAALKGFNGAILDESLDSVDDIVKRLEETNARVLYLDPMQNRESMRCRDVQGVIDRWREKHPDRQLTVVVDGTMTSMADGLYDDPEDNVEVLYYASGCKYLQLGQDVVSAGMLAFPKHLTSKMKDIRRATGTILYDSDAWAFPKIDKEFYDWRMNRMRRNAIVIADVINNDPALSPYVQAVYPGHPDHPDYDMTKDWPATGGLMTFRFKDGALDHESLNRIVNDYIADAGAEGLSLVNGESFGFRTPRIYVGWTPANSFPPFLRLAVGDRTLEETQAYAQSLQKTLRAALPQHYQTAPENEARSRAGLRRDR